MTTKLAQYEWRTYRTDVSALSDDDWADDASDALPSHSFSVSDGAKEVEFMVLGYVDSTNQVSDNDTDTYSCDVTYLIDLPRGSTIGTGASGLARSGNTSANAKKIAVAGPTMSGLRFFKPYTFECRGAREVALRLHTSSGAPGTADRYEVQIREIPK